jgi:DNA-binding NarL/FixJ family response regulator
MYMSEATVKTHVSRILTKTGSENRVQVALLVYQAQSARG